MYVEQGGPLTAGVHRFEEVADHFHMPFAALRRVGDFESQMPNEVQGGDLIAGHHAIDRAIDEWVGSKAVAIHPESNPQFLDRGIVYVAHVEIRHEILVGTQVGLTFRQQSLAVDGCGAPQLWGSR